MKNGICYVVGAGTNYGLDFCPGAEDYVIAADAGFRYLEMQGIPADLIIGDFDSLKSVPKHLHTIVLPPEKDDTDMLAALREGIKAGYEKFHIYCGTGGRIDHTLANIQTLAWLSENGMQGLLFDQESILTAVTNGRLCFEKIAGGYLSVFSHTTKAEGVYLTGLKYELENAVLTHTFPLGTSNEFIDRESSISVRQGTLIVVFPRGVWRKMIP
ncbi:MAG: thiamine diphosphokinase [Lachnospiraceae bacterium]|nr:thiamine diphosphokinase [Lachnospiraceae bacterium]